MTDPRSPVGNTDIAAAPRLRALVETHLVSARLLAALAVVLGPEDAAACPVRTCAVETLRAFGLGEAVARALPKERRAVLAAVTAELLFAGRLLSHPVEAGVWTEADPALHQAFGDVSVGFADLLAARIAPRLAGLETRLAAPGGAVLDVGTGVGALAIALVRCWPGLRVVGIEPLPAVAARATAAVAAAGLARSVEIRIGSGEAVTDRDAFDLAFVPSAFIAPDHITGVVASAAAALRPGGWLLLVAAAPTLGEADLALLRFRVTAWGGTLLGPDAARAVIATAGLAFAEAGLLPLGPGLVVAAGRRSGADLPDGESPHDNGRPLQTTPHLRRPA